MEKPLYGEDESLFLKNNRIATSELVLNNPTIYKYCNFNDAMLTLSNSTIAFKSPLYFNDPYDCTTNLFDFSVPEGYREHVVSLHGGHLTPEERHLKLQNLLNTPEQDFIDNHRKVLMGELNLRGISCFSMVYNNLLMWAHYGVSHSGVCIGFNQDALYSYLYGLYNFNVLFIAVEYSKEIKRVNRYKRPIEAFVNWIRTKSKDWEYEKEIRIMLNGIKFNHQHLYLQSISKTCINSILLGTNITEENEAEIRQLSAKMYPSIEVKKLKLAVNKFELGV